MPYDWIGVGLVDAADLDIKKSSRTALWEIDWPLFLELWVSCGPPGWFCRPFASSSSSRRAGSGPSSSSTAAWSRSSVCSIASISFYQFNEYHWSRPVVASSGVDWKWIISWNRADWSARSVEQNFWESERFPETVAWFSETEPLPNGR